MVQVGFDSLPRHQGFTLNYVHLTYSLCLSQFQHVHQLLLNHSRLTCLQGKQELYSKVAMSTSTRMYQLEQQQMYCSTLMYHQVSGLITTALRLKELSIKVSLRHSSVVHSYHHLYKQISQQLGLQQGSSPCLALTQSGKCSLINYHHAIKHRIIQCL